MSQRPQSGRGRSPEFTGGRGRGGDGGSGRGSSEGRGGGRGRDGGGRGGGGGRSSSAGPGRGSIPESQAQQRVKESFLSLVINCPPREVDGLCARPNVGKSGQPVTLFANHFKVEDVPSQLSIRQYDVAMERRKAPQSEQSRMKYGGPLPDSGPPPMPDRNTCHKVLNRLGQIARWPAKRWAYDGQKLLFTATEFIPHEGIQMFVELEDHSPGVQSRDSMQATGAGEKPRSVVYEVRIKPTREVSHQLPIGQQLQEYGRGAVGNTDVLRDGMHALDVALRQSATEDGSSRMVGRGVYSSDTRKRLGWGIEAWHGYTQTLNVTQSGLTLSLDAAVIAMPVMEELIAWVADILRRPRDQLKIRELTGAEVDTLNQFIKRKGITIQVMHRATGKLRFKLKGFTPTSARRSNFTQSDGTDTSVEAYFKTTYKKALSFPLLPCAVVGGHKKPEWLPLEYCRIVPDTGSRALGPEETAAILKEAAVQPDIRQKKIMHALINSAKLHTDPVAQAFGIKLSSGAAPQMLKVPGRVLPQPMLNYAGKCLDPGQKGDWNLMGTKFVRGATLRSFAVVSFAPEQKVGGEVMGTFLEELRQMLEASGVTVGLPAYPPVVYKTRRDVSLQALNEGVRRASDELGIRPQILFVIVENETHSLYAEIKRLCDCEIGVQSQVLVAPNMKIGFHGPPGAMGRKLAGVALKVNTKLGGDNTSIAGNISVWCPAVKKAVSGGSRLPQVMLMGADVSHPTNLPGQGKTEERNTDKVDKRPLMPSVAAIVGSMNAECTQFACRIYKQDPLQEFVENMGRATYDLLNLYKARNNGSLPDVIIMFRDGVSEGQFRPLLAKELKDIQKACGYFAANGVSYTPKITFVTVQKRHQTRLFPCDPQSRDVAAGTKDTGNVRPGVVVDQGICHPREFDFYLNSHAGIQGTNKCAKYSVLYDDLGFSADSMQLLSYWLCHTFCRCTRTVSYCPPAYYAHHAAFRGRCWLQREDLAGASETASESSGAGTANSEAWKWEFSTPHDNIKDTMFWI